MKYLVNLADELEDKVYCQLDQVLLENKRVDWGRSRWTVKEQPNILCRPHTSDVVHHHLHCPAPEVDYMISKAHIPRILKLDPKSD